MSAVNSEKGMLSLYIYIFLFLIPDMYMFNPWPCITPQICHDCPTSTSLASHVSWTDFTRLMWGMLRWRSEQAWQTNTPRVSDAQSGSAGGRKEGAKRRIRRRDDVGRTSAEVKGEHSSWARTKEREGEREGRKEGRRKWNENGQSGAGEWQTDKRGGVRRSCHKGAATKRIAAQGSGYKYWKCWCGCCTEAIAAK